MSERKNLIDGLYEEITRCKEVLEIYEEIPQGAWGAFHIRNSIKRAESALSSGDPIEMMQSIKDLESIE